MSTRPISGDLRALGVGLASRVRAGFIVLRRTTPALMLLRLLVFGAMVAGFALAVGWDGVASRAFVLAVTGALAAALFPRTWVVTAALLTAGAAWLFATTAGPVEPALWRVLALAAALYIAHAAAAFAAVLPYDCVVAPSALRRWAARTSFVVVVSIGLGGAAIGLLDRLRATPTVLAPIAGALLAATIAGLIAWLVRRRTA
jgi:hypothetical protein